MLSVKLEKQNETARPEGSHLHNSFIRSVSRQVRSHKLGDLLLASGLITSYQLDSALQTQRVNGDRLGKVLLEQGSLSAVQLYRKLAEQWCIKASTAGVALMMQVMTPAAAKADDSGSAVRLAAAFSTATLRPATPHGLQPGLFGTTEVRSDGVAMFPKWTSVMRRFDEQMASQGLSPTVQAWKSHLAAMKNLTAAEQIEGVNNYINSVRYVEDGANYKKSDYWATPIEFLTRGGDCEDYAIAKYASLRALGFSADQMRIAIVQDQVKNVPHAILVVYTDGVAHVLDNQDRHVRDAGQINRYKPIFSLNSNNWWLHKRA